MVKPSVLKLGSRKRVFQVTAAIGVISFILMVVTLPPSEEAIALKEQEEQEKLEAERRKKDKEEAGKRLMVKAKDSWPEFNQTMNEHYKDVGVIAIQANEDFKIFDAIVPNEFKLSNENEKQYYVDEVGPLIKSDITQHFNGEFISLYFKYEDGSRFADPKFSGGWKIKK